MLLIAAPTAAQPNQRPGCGQASDSAAFIQKVWDKSRWERKRPKPAALEAWHQILRCQPAARKSWREAKRAFYRHRGKMLFRVRYTPFYCSDSEMTFDGGWYAIPCYNVNQESGGRGGWTCNTYGILDYIWALYGGPYGGACGNSEREQSIVAARIYDEVGSAAWTPFEE